MRRPPPFLAIFFTVLGILFSIAVVLRLRSHAEPVQTPHAGKLDTRELETPAAEPRSASTGTIVELDGRQERAGTTQLMSERERRYRELLETKVAGAAPAAAASQIQPPSAIDSTPSRPIVPVSPKPAPAPPQSALPRVLAPIVKVFSTTPVAPVSSQPGDGRHDRDTTRPDPTSDTRPPQLQAVEFNPPVLHDGEETILTVVAVDDLSGVQSVSGSVASPAGGLQGFALQREAETNRFVGKIAVPKDAPDGWWKVNFLNLTDNANNAATLTLAQGGIPQSAAFRVTSSRPDSTGPVLRSIYAEKRGMRCGEKNTIFVQADDDKSGVALVTGVFKSPAGLARIGMGCRAGAEGMFQCDLSPPSCLDCGVWSLEQLQLQDKANNMTTVRSDSPLVSAIKVDITCDSCDSMPPSIQLVSLSPPSVRNTETSFVQVTVRASDDVCGISSISGQVAGPSGPGGQSPLNWFTLEPTADPQTFTGRITIKPLSAKGGWNLIYIQVFDKGSNLKTYSRSDPVMGGAGFRVE